MTRSSPIRIADGVEAGGGAPLLVIAGPDLIESETHALEMAGALSAATAQRGVGFVYKSSFDKANRTSVDSPRGPGLEEGLAILDRVKRECGVAVTTDFHTPDQAAQVAEVADLLQVPAFLCRQTDMLVAAGRSGRAVNVKKGQFGDTRPGESASSFPTWPAPPSPSASTRCSSRSTTTRRGRRATARTSGRSTRSDRCSTGCSRSAVLPQIRSAALAAAACGFAGCAATLPDPGPAQPLDTVLVFLALPATTDEHGGLPEGLLELVVHADRLPDDPGRLLDALDGRPAGNAELLSRSRMAEIDRSAFALAFQADGLATACEVQLAEGAVWWFSCPGIEWPTVRVRGDELTSSAPPRP
jgi:hypothetical protein